MPLVGIFVLLKQGYTPMLAALLGLLMVIGVSFLHAETRLSLRDFIQGLEDGTRAALPVIIACATAGIIVDLAGGSVYITLIFTMISSLILGMGVPTTANYIIQATISAPALIQVGIQPLAAHLFVFYFGIIADITPPVAMAALAASGIAKSDPFRTGFEAFKLGFAAYIVPYVFVMFPSLLWIQFSFSSFAEGFLSTSLTIFAIGSCATGYLHRVCARWERVLLLALALASPRLEWEIPGFIVLAALYLYQRFSVKPM